DALQHLNDPVNGRDPSGHWFEEQADGNLSGWKGDPTHKSNDPGWGPNKSSGSSGSSGPSTRPTPGGGSGIHAEGGGGFSYHHLPVFGASLGLWNYLAGSYNNPTGVRLGWEWLSGTGPAKRNFTMGDVFTDSFLNSSTFHKTQDYFYNKYQGNITDLSTLDNFDAGFGPGELISDPTLSGQFLGSIAMTKATASNGYITYNFKNSSTIDSFLYSTGKLEFLNIPRSDGFSPPGSTITQHITATVPVEKDWPLNSDFCEKTGVCQ
ncbi:MAG: hypothetical protein KDE03_14410, partial [Rhodobacteraceae bacterium]|nr:hypothetical protein [Paracoccaceae bacterium]